MVIESTGIVGAGTMGSGIAQVFAQAGYEVKVVDVVPEQLEKSAALIDKNLSRSVEKGRLSVEEKQAIIRRISYSGTLEDLAPADLVVEAIVEDVKAKAQVFARLDEICSPNALLTSNTSSIPITQIAACTRRPAQVAGMHFFNPVPLMQLVEVIRGVQTTQQTVDTVMAVAKAAGKTPVTVEDYPGFVANRILLPMINEAIFALHEGVASRDDIDTVMRLGMNHPMGPLQLADFIGLDVCLAIMDVLYEGYKDSKYRPCPLLRKLVQAGYLGRKSGRGFYEYQA